MEVNKALFEISEGYFLSHLSRPLNQRIILSGRFGIGKSTFIEYFFSEEVQNNNFKKRRYYPFILRPVHYSIASNEDIIEYIKYDLLHEVLRNREMPGRKYSELKIYEGFLKGNKDKILSFFLNAIPKIGRSLNDSRIEFNNLRKLLNEYQDAFGSKEEMEVSDFIAEIDHKHGSIYEQSIISDFIGQVVDDIPNKDEEEKVLIIDDLDRIDPEHVFRILNVFAAHFDSKGQQQLKFGFDKIILVCDVNNLYNIFKTRFGAEADFIGYIDKFYSYEVFAFDGRNIQRDLIASILKPITFTSPPSQFEEREVPTWFGTGCFTARVLMEAVFCEAINLRALVRWGKDGFCIDNKKVAELPSSLRITITNFMVLPHFMVLKKIFGSFESLKGAILKLREIKAERLCNYQFVSQMIILLFCENRLPPVKVDPNCNYTLGRTVYTIESFGSMDTNSEGVSICYSGGVKREKYEGAEIKEIILEFISFLERNF